MPVSTDTSPPRIAVTGLGGYARHHHLTLQRLENAGLCQVVATCEPSLERILPQSADLRLAERGVKIFPDFESMLAGLDGQAEAVTIPTPIHLHASMHKACVQAGLPVYLEKPPTLWWEELEAMIATEAGATLATEVGFNFITEPARQELKARLLAGEFGRLREVGFVGLWPRPAAYFLRNDWAGKLFRDDSTVPLLDSCFGNAMGHYMQNLLFWAGPQQASFATVLEVHANLYRAHAIEGADTVFAQARTTEGVVLRLGATHSCAQEHEGHAEYIKCEFAQLRYVTDRACEIFWVDGRREVVDLRTQGDWQERNFRRYFGLLAGKSAAPVVSLRDCRPFVAWNDLIYAATPGITTVMPPDLESSLGSVIPIPRGIGSALTNYVEKGQWPHEVAELAWARPPGRAHLADLPLVFTKLQALRPLANDLG